MNKKMSEDNPSKDINLYYILYTKRGFSKNFFPYMLYILTSFEMCSTQTLVEICFCNVNHAKKYAKFSKQAMIALEIKCNLMFSIVFFFSKVK